MSRLRRRYDEGLGRLVCRAYRYVCSMRTEFNTQRKSRRTFQLNTTRGVLQAPSASVTATKSLHLEILRVYIL
jgi:hypothetical protein